MFEVGKKEDKKKEEIKEEKKEGDEEKDLIQEQIELEKKETEKKNRLNARLLKARNMLKNKTQNNPFYKSVEVTAKASELEKVLTKQNNNNNENNNDDKAQINNLKSVEDLMISKPVVKRNKKKKTNFTIEENE